MEYMDIIASIYMEPMMRPAALDDTLPLPPNPQSGGLDLSDRLHFFFLLDSLKEIIVCTTFGS